MPKKRQAKKKTEDEIPKDVARKLYENSGPTGIKATASLPKVRFQKAITKSKEDNFKVFHRYLKFKFGTEPKIEEAPVLPVKRPKNTMQKNLYDLLKLEPGCEKSEIKKSYRKLVTKHHPDKGGNPLHFRCLNKAYEILENDEIREIYDNDGFKGVKAMSDIDIRELENYVNSNQGF